VPPQPRAPRAILLALAVALCGALCAATSASAATRFAAPGGIGVDPCANPADPCTFFTAASGEALGSTLKAGDEVVLASGEYSDFTSDLGPEGVVRLPLGITVHGIAGRPRPVIHLNRVAGAGGLVVTAGDTVSHLEIDTTVARSNIVVLGGTVEDLIARSSTAGIIVCNQLGGLIRNSACLSSGAGAAAMGMGVQGSMSMAVQLRNVTAVATGAGSSGFSYRLTSTGTGSLDVLAKSVIAQGTAADIFAAGLSGPPHTPGTGANVRIELDHSDYETVGTFTDVGGGTASVTLPGTAANVMDPPLLAADGYHQLPGSPTVEAGASDGFTGNADPDGQLRAIGDGIDIGADELGHTTSAQLSCLPTALTIGGGPSTCTVTVTDIAPGGSTPTGTVVFSTTGPGAFGAETCELGPAIGPASSCQATYIPSQPGSGTHTIEVTYLGDEVRDPSRTTVPVPVAGSPGGGGGGGGAGEPPRAPPSSPPLPPPTPPRTTIAKKPAKRTTTALARFVFSSDQAGGSFECHLDGGAFRRCVSPFKKIVRPGRHAFSVRAVGPTGTPDPTPAMYRWNVLGR
jgi:hypothetical protein